MANQTMPIVAGALESQGVLVTFLVSHPGIEAPVDVPVEVPCMMVRSPKRNRRRQGIEGWFGRRQGVDGRWVQRDMVIARDHDPPFKWHRVVDEQSGRAIKDQAVNMATGEVVDLTCHARPIWLPFFINREGAGGTSASYEIAPDESSSRLVKIHLSAEDAERLGEALSG